MVNPRRFPDSELVERNPKLDVDALYRTGSLFMDFTLGVPLAHGDDPGRNRLVARVQMEDWPKLVRYSTATFCPST